MDFQEEAVDTAQDYEGFSCFTWRAVTLVWFESEVAAQICFFFT